MNYVLEYKIFSENSILITWPAKIDKNVLHDLQSYKSAIENNYNKVIIEIISTYNSMLIIYSSTINDVYSEILQLKALYKEGLTSVEVKNRLWKIPVCYQEKFAPNLKLFAAKKSLTIDEVIKLHTAPLYIVYFIGFLPGFLYLGGLSENLSLPRKSTPVLKVDKGAVAIGGNQTGIYPQESPGGWHVIGNTPVSFFDIKSIDLCFVKPGDVIQFISIDENKYNDISLMVGNGVYVADNEII